jgi:hypothetical protein
LITVKKSLARFGEWVHKNMKNTERKKVYKNKNKEIKK